MLICYTITIIKRAGPSFTESQMHVRLAAILMAIAAPATADVPRVAADILPVHGLVSRVMDGVGTPLLVVPPAASIHGHDLRPSEAAALEQADIVFWIGEDLSPWLLRPVTTLASDAIVVSLLGVDGTLQLPFRDAEGFDPEAGHDTDHEHGEIDPHAWLDPDNARHWLDAIAETLAAADPANAARYHANAAAGREEITIAVEAAAAKLDDAGTIGYAVFHDAYQYFEARFGLSPVAAVTLGDAAAPGPARIASIQKQLSSNNVNCFLIEPQQDRSLMKIFSDTGPLRLVEIDPMGMRVPTGSTHYPALIASLAESFAACR
jgi:zinc transport system substrate-binding protein